MGTIVVPENFLRSKWVERRNQIFESMQNIGYDLDSALLIAREQTDWEFRDWKTHESQEQCDTQKDYDDIREGDWTR